MSAIPILRLSTTTSSKAQTRSSSKDTSEQKATQNVTKGSSLKDIDIDTSSTCLGTAKTTQQSCKHSIPQERRDAAKVLEKEILLAAADKDVKKQPKNEEQEEGQFVIIDQELGSLLISMARILLCHNHKEQLKDVVDSWMNVVEGKQPVEEAQVPAVTGKDPVVDKEEEVKDGEEAKQEVKIEEEGESDKKEKEEVKTDSKPSISGGWTSEKKVERGIGHGIRH